MDIKETLDFIKEADWKGSVLGLSRMEELLRLLGNPQKSLRFIHVAGTNGKGSVCAMLSSILREAGYKTGLFISPHLSRYNERIQINGREISDEELSQAALRVREAVLKMADTPTEFERVLALALIYFLESSCDIIVMEVGLGGRLDATNIIDPPLLAIITHIALDHTAILGNTLPLIAREKAGIVKEYGRVLMASAPDEVREVIETVCRERGARLYITEPVEVPGSHEEVPVFPDHQVIDYKSRRGLRLSLGGSYQPENASIVLDAVDILNKIENSDTYVIYPSGKDRDNPDKKADHINPEEGHSPDRKMALHIPEEAVIRGLSSVSWPGRFEVLCSSPLFIADGAHNPDGMDRLALSIQNCFPDKKIIFIISIMRDKDYRYMIRKLLPFAKAFKATAPDYDRALPSEELAAAIRELTDIPTEAFAGVEGAVEAALSSCMEEELIIACGSLYQLGEVRACVLSDEAAKINY